MRSTLRLFVLVRGLCFGALLCAGIALAAAIAFGGPGRIAPLPSINDLGPDAENYRPDSGGWVSVGIPRIIALNILNALHVTALNDCERR